MCANPPYLSTLSPRGEGILIEYIEYNKFIHQLNSTTLNIILIILLFYLNFSI